MSFIFKITTTTSPQSFVIPCHNYGAFNATVDYGDGTGSQTITAYNDSNLTHSFATAGQHTITIGGTFPNIRFDNDATSAALVDEVVDLGDVGWLMLYGAFSGCTNLTSFSTGTSNTVNNTFTQLMFKDCASLTTLDFTNFNTSNVNEFARMFQGCASITTLDLSSFDTSNVTNMFLMFLGCTNLTTLDVSSFDTSNVTDMQLMFTSCTNLTSLDIKHFDVTSVTNASSFLQGANNALTTAAYDELLEAWATQDVQLNVPWHFGDAQYTVVNIADWYSPRSASSLSIINNKLVSIADSTAIFGAGQQIDNLVVGNVYKMTATSTCNNAAATMFFSVSVDATLTPSVIFTQGTSTALIDNTFTATTTTMYFGVVVAGHAANDTVTIDAGIAVKEITNYAAANAASDIENSQQANNSVAYQNIAQTSDVRDTYTLIEGDWVGSSELVANGNFATDSDWALFNGATISNNRANIIGDGSSFTSVSQANVFEGDKQYSINLDVVINSGLGIKIQSAGNEDIGFVTTTGNYTFTFNQLGSTSLIIGRRTGGTPFSASIDNVSVKRLIEVAP